MSGIPAAQAETAALLGRETGAAPRETHISAIFAGRERVLKLRKAVRLSFVDFTDLATRERTARRELALNAPHAPGMYCAVLPVMRGPEGALRLSGEGAPVDWVVEMARVPDEDFLDAIAARGDLDDALLDRIADAVAAYHRALPAVGRDTVQALLRVAAGNAQAARDAGIAAAGVAAWEEGVRAAITARAGWMQWRSEAGFVRRAHGDLHLGNLCLWRGAPVPFDALEFDEDLATIDIGYDLAFLLMDLEHRAGRAQANRVLNRVVARGFDHAMVAGLPSFLSLRAMVRAHVEGTRGHAEDARAYLAQAMAALAPPPPVLIAIGGLPGTGKSTLARAAAPGLGPAPGALVLRSDEIRKRLHGAAPEQRLPPAAYAEAASRVVMETLAAAARSALAGGHAVIADATFLDPADRHAIEAAAGDVRFVGIWLDAPLELLERRVAERRGDASDATVEVLRRAAARPEQKPAAWHRVDATDLGAAQAAVRLLAGAV